MFSWIVFLIMLGLIITVYFKRKKDRKEFIPVISLTFTVFIYLMNSYGSQKQINHLDGIVKTLLEEKKQTEYSRLLEFRHEIKNNRDLLEHQLTKENIRLLKSGRGAPFIEFSIDAFSNGPLPFDITRGDEIRALSGLYASWKRANSLMKAQEREVVTKEELGQKIAINNDLIAIFKYCYSVSESCLDLLDQQIKAKEAELENSKIN